MLNKGKLLFGGIGVIATAGLLVSFANSNDDDKKKKYQIIHHENGEMRMHDTIISMNSTYTVENFLADKGIQSENVEIIDMPHMGEHEMMFIGEEGSEGMHGEHIMIKECSKHIEHKGDGEMVKIICEVGEDGKMVTKKFVNGEEVELTEKELEQIKMHKKIDKDHMIIEIDSDHINNEELNFVHEGDGKEIKIICEIDDEGNMSAKKIIDGVEVELTQEELEEMKMHHNGDGHHMMIKIDTDEMGEDMEEMLKQVELELSELDIDMEELEKEIEISIEKIIEESETGEDGEHKMIVKKMVIDEDGEGKENVFIMHDSDVTWESTGEEEDFTIVIVTENYDVAHEKSRDIKHKDMQTSDLEIYPNPSDGTFTIRINQSEKVKTSINITDVNGKVVFKDNLGKFSGEYKEEIDLKKFGPGTYIINIQQGDNLSVEKIIIK
jgi:Secretion system C-terminal sorting domain